MKNFALFSLATILFISACSKDSDNYTPVAGNQAQLIQQNPTYTGVKFRYSGADYSQPIPIDDANNMIQSYLTSINYPNNQTDLRSLTFDADTLRAYLADGRIKTLKFMLAHQPGYAATNYGMNAGMKANAITMVIVGLNESEQYIYNGNDMVYEHFRPCPDHCSASGALLTN
jgi:hypothetical protein